jgi:hypothetical protein
MTHYENTTQGGETFDLEEGNFTYNEKTLLKSGEYREGGSFASQLDDGDFVEICTSADKTVQLSASGIQIGFIDGDPRGPLPGESKTSGNYTRRYGNIVLVGWKRVRVKLIATNQAVSPGDYLGIASGKNVMDKEEDTTTNIVAIESADASSGIYIDALAKGVPQAVAD